ncbi:MAG: LTA synthase family protein [Roseburia sp.]
MGEQVSNEKKRVFQVKKKGFTFEWRPTWRNSIISVIALAVMLFLCIYGKTNVLYGIGAGLVVLLLLCIRVELPRQGNLLWVPVILGFSAWMSVKLVQYMLLEEDLRGKISTNRFWLNVLCALLLYLIMLAVSARTNVACGISHVFWIFLASVNYFVYQFRGNEFSMTDIKAASTGLSVASKYQFVIEERFVFAVILSVIYVVAISRIRITFLKKWLGRVLALSLFVLGVVWFAKKTESTVVESWEQKGTYRNGYLMNFVLGIRDSIITAPEGYSEEAIIGLESQYLPVDETGTESDPTIIVIMNESFADLSVLSGGEMATTEEVMPFYDSLDENIVKGYALSSVFGAKTPDSEWEFLTGNSMAFLPSGSVPYQQYMSGDDYSLVRFLSNRGYTCKSVHPYYSSGWSRNKVYPELGFTESLFIEDFDQSNLMREYISDQQMYEKIVEMYEEKPSGEKLFVLGVTMQNHGGYGDDYANFTNSVALEDYYFSDVNQYLSLIRESDKALEYLITYFEQVDEPVEIVFFGDHQPSLNSSFYKTQNGSGLSGLTLSQLEDLFKVPFFIWTNYDSESREVELTSLNYLSTMTLEQAGIELPPYHQFLKELQQVIPAMNARAFYSVSEGKFRHYEDANEFDREWLEKYEILQYNNMFDQDRSKIFN